MVWGAGLVGCETAYFLAEKGKDVTQIEAIRATHPSMKVVTADTLANVSSEERFHPGAKKFFKEVNVKIGFHGVY